ncbi:MAG: MFS transporter [Legionella sp.]|nr:MAG: MFS transporter [Legionella sp.]
MQPFYLLTSRRLVPLFMTQFLGACNDNLLKNALVIFIVFHLSDSLGLNAQLFVAIASGLFILPFFLCSTTAGLLADKYKKSDLILRIKAVELLLMPLAALGFYLQNITILMTALFLIGIQATFFGPLKYAILPELLQEDELIAGNGLIEAGTFIAILLGTILGGTLMLHPHGKVIISSILMALAFLGWLSAWFIPASTHAQDHLVINFNLFQELQSLFQYTQLQKDIFLSMLGISWFWLFGATLLSTLPHYTKHVLHADQTVVTFFFALFSIGLALGSLLYTGMSKKKPHANAIYLSLLGMTVFTLDICRSSQAYISIHVDTLMNVHQFLSTPQSYGVIFDFCCIAILGGLYTVPLYTLLQSRTVAAHRARVMACNNIMNAGCMLVSALLIMSTASLHHSSLYMLWMLAAGTGVVTWLLYQRRDQLAVNNL